MIDTRYKHETLHQCSKRVKTKSQKPFGPNSYVCSGDREKTAKEGPFFSKFGIFFRNVFKNGKLKTIKIKLKLKFMKIQISIQNTKTICKKLLRDLNIRKCKKTKTY